MRFNSSPKRRIIGLLLLASTLAINLAAQPPRTIEQEIINGANTRWWYTVIFLVFMALVGAAYLWLKSRMGNDLPRYNYDNRYASSYKKESYQTDGVDSAKELEWLRKAKKPTAKAGAAAYEPNDGALPRSRTTKAADANDLNFDTRIFQEKMRKLQYSQLPINSFSELSPAKMYEPLPVANDSALLNAIEQANEEFEEDESVRDLAVRILTAFRTRNSVEALAQIALYDLSSNLRSKAVTTLTDFDHESVFETILLAYADPTREVRAAAARGLFRLNFDRAHAWKRIIETNDEFRMSHAARAAVESGIVLKSFDRLIHEDLKVAYEAFALVTLLIRSGETKEIFESIREHKDERVRFALLHVLKVHKDERTLDDLRDLQKDGMFPTDVADRIRDTISSFETVLA